MKAISSGLLAHINQDTTTICTCWKVSRTDGVILAFTDHDQDLVVSGVTYKASDSYTRSALKSDQSLAVDNLEVMGMLDSDAISDVDLKNGLYDYAEVQMFVVNWTDLSQGILRLRQGWFGEVTITPTGVFKAELRGLTQALVSKWGNYFSPVCRADLGDSKCQYNLAAHSHTGTVTEVIANNKFSSTPLDYTPYSATNKASITVDSTMNDANAGLGIQIVINGSVVMTYTIPMFDNAAEAISHMVLAINAASIGVTAAPNFVSGSNSSVILNLSNVNDTANVSKLNDPNHYLTINSFAEGFMTGGVVTWLSGNNTGIGMEIKTYVQSTSTIVIFLSMKYPIQVGDTFSFTPGCDKRRETCHFKFNNIANFRGEPDMPGFDAILTFPEAFQGQA